MSDAFEPPGSERARPDLVTERARQDLLYHGGVALGLGFLQILYDPFLLVSLSCAWASWIAIGHPRRSRRHLGERHPDDAGRLSTAGGAVGLLLLAANLLLRALAAIAPSGA